MTALHLHWSTKATFGDIDRAVDDAFRTLCYPPVREEQRELCVLFGHDCFSQSVLAASLQDDSSKCSTMVTNSSHNSLVCFDHYRRSTPSFYTSTVHCVHTVDHVGAHATHYYASYVRARESDMHTRRECVVRGYSSAICTRTALYVCAQLFHPGACPKNLVGGASAQNITRHAHAQ